MPYMDFQYVPQRKIMSYDDLIARLRQYAVNRGSNPADWRVEAADAIATIQAELAAVREENAKWLAFARDLPDGELGWKARAEAAEARVKELEGTCVPISDDAKSVFIEGRGIVAIDYDGRAERLRLAAEKAVEAIESAACDVEAYTKVEYGWPNIHPSQKVKFERDMAHVAEIRAARAGLMEAMEASGTTSEPQG